MTDLIKEHKPFVEAIQNMQRKFNDSNENPLFNNGNIYEKCDITEASRKKSKTFINKMNVLILIIDSTSLNHFQRIFPLTFNYLKSLENNIIFKNYNVIASNSYPNMLPFFTGLYPENNPDLNLTGEMHHVAQFDKEKFEDLQPFIWKDYEKENYVTMYSEDNNWMGLFNYLAKGIQSFYIEPYLSFKAFILFNKDFVVYRQLIIKCHCGLLILKILYVFIKNLLI